MQTKKIFKKLGSFALVAALVLLGLFWLLPILLPFLLGYVFSLLADPGVRALRKKTPLPRWLCSGICVTLLFLLVGVLLYFLLRVLFSELTELINQLPGFLSELQEPMETIRLWLTSLVSKAPDGLAASLEDWLNSLFVGGSVLMDSLYRWLAGLVSDIVNGVPGLLLGSMTTILSTYMLCAGLPEVKAWLKKKLPFKWQRWLTDARSSAKGALGGWVKAQLTLMGITFAILSLGLWVLGVDFFLLFGAVIALVDALPVLGSGTILLPWSFISFLQSNSKLGFGILALYGIVSVTRSALEPRLVGRQIGLHPLLTLLAFYVGFRLFGVAGMILLPIGAILTKQFVTLTEHKSFPAEQSS